MDRTQPANAIDRVCAWVEDWQKQRRTRAELAEMTPDELSQMAGDVGLTTEELLSAGAIGTNAKASELMPTRLEALGLDPENIRECEPAVYRDLQRVCSHCASARKCQRDMAHGDIETGMESYCANAPTIDALLLERR